MRVQAGPRLVLWKVAQYAGGGRVNCDNRRIHMKEEAAWGAGKVL